MAGSRALPDLVSRIRVDSSGVDQAISSLISGFGRANLALVGAAAGIGLIVAGGKSMLDIYEKHMKAVKDLKQAVDVHNTTLGTQGRIVVDLSKQEDALTVARNGATKAQIAYSNAIKAHGAHSEQARIASMNLQDAEIRLGQAQDALATARAKDSAGVSTQAVDYATLQGQIDEFIKTNRRYISDQSEVVDGNAKLIRAGLSVAETQRVMNDAVDLAAIKHISLTDAVDVLQKAEEGRMKGLIDLGITTSQLTDADGNLLKGHAAVGAAMKEVDDKVRKGRDTMSDLDQNTNILRNDWQTLAEKGGPVIYTLLDTVVTKANDVYDAFDRLGRDDNLWGGISDRLVDIAGWIRDWVIIPLQKLFNLGLSPYDPSGGTVFRTTSQEAQDRAASSRTGGFGKGGRQFGGPVLPGSVYTVGEAGPETLVMGSDGGGGYVIPNHQGGGPRGGGDTLHFHQVVSDPWQISNELSWRRKTRRV